MGIAYLHGNGGGGASLNFKIMGGVTEPTSPKENMIWVNTENKITSWIFSAVEPTELEEGMLWISTGVSSTVAFNALKKNCIPVYPIFAKQYIGGVLADVTAKSYQGGAWVDWWNGEMYQNGNEFPNITGGWKLVKEGSEGSISNSNKKLTITAGGASNGVAAITNGLINLTDVKFIHFSVSEVNKTGTNSNAEFFVTKSGNSTWSHITSVVASTYKSTIEPGVYTVNVESLSGEYYVGFCNHGSAAIDMSCDKIWWEE